MSFNDINDPAGVKALLDQLRSSQAWQDAITPNIPCPSDCGESRSIITSRSDGAKSQLSSKRPEEPTTSVSSLLSQLQPVPLLPSFSHPLPRTSTGVPPVDTVNLVSEHEVPPTTTTDSGDHMAMSFQQALPHLANLSAKPEFVAKIKELKLRQDNLERELWQERRNIQKHHEGKVNIRRMEADKSGNLLKQEEADMMTADFRRELHKFDLERVLPAWDSLVEQQQSSLRSLGVPAMYCTTSVTDREKQHRVMQVLEGVC